jgi:ribosome-associated protein
MRDDAWLRAGKQLRIPRSEISFRATRSSGPGGQHVNTSSTRVELWWNLETSSAPTDAQRALLRERLAGRLDGEGWLRLTESGSRSQFRNREAVTERFATLLARAVVPVKRRKPTRVPARAKQKRLEGKRQRGKVKLLRSRVHHDE